MKIKISFICIISILLLTACNNNGITNADLGEVTYYPSFLFCGADTQMVTKTIHLDFNQDAQADKDCFAEFQFVGNDGKTPISDKEMETYIDGKKLKGNIFRVDPSMKELKIRFSFTDQAKSGKHQGKLLLTRHKIDRIDSGQSLQLSKGQQAEVLQWTINFKKRWNPLKLGLLWFLIVLILIFAIWMIFIKPIKYPHIHLSRIQLQCDKTGYYDNKRINGKRMVVFCNERVKQHWLNKFLTGEILYIVNDVWTKPLEITARRRGGQLHLHGNYEIEPFVYEIQSNQEYTITNIETRNKITINS